MSQVYHIWYIYSEQFNSFGSTAGIFVARTAYELCEALESMRDLDEVYAGLGMQDEVLAQLSSPENLSAGL